MTGVCRALIYFWLKGQFLNAHFYVAMKGIDNVHPPAPMSQKSALYHLHVDIHCVLMKIFSIQIFSAVPSWRLLLMHQLIISRSPPPATTSHLTPWYQELETADCCNTLIPLNRRPAASAVSSKRWIVELETNLHEVSQYKRRPLYWCFCLVEKTY